MKMETLTLGSTGPNVKLIQSLLNKMGYNPGPLDGIFGQMTQLAVAAFQRDAGLVADGVVGTITWNSFNNILRGYANYIVSPGDTFYDIARRFYTTVNAVITANPGIDPNYLFVGQNIVVPYGIDVVFTDIDYTYEIMEMNIKALKARYPFLEVGVAGNSVMGKSLYYIRLGSGPNQVFYNGSHHAFEWITSSLLMKFIENYAKAYSTGRNIRGNNISHLFNQSSIYIIPMVNPDGVDLVLGAIAPQSPFYQLAVSINYTGLPISQVWKANIRGTDLNLNYPANWDLEKQYELSIGITGPSPQGYGGPTPLSEPETAAIVNFTYQHDFRLVIAYHTQGDVIYWQYFNLAPPESSQIAERFSEISGYSVSSNPEEASYAGYKDWFIMEYGRPGFTIEVGLGVNPISIYQFDTIYNENEGILLLAAVI